MEGWRDGWMEGEMDFHVLQKFLVLNPKSGTNHVHIKNHLILKNIFLKGIVSNKITLFNFEMRTYFYIGIR